VANCYRNWVYSALGALNLRACPGFPSLYAVVSVLIELRLALREHIPENTSMDVDPAEALIS
jgi:hypothetical protein